MAEKVCGGREERRVAFAHQLWALARAGGGGHHSRCGSDLCGVWGNREVLREVYRLSALGSRLLALGSWLAGEAARCSMGASSRPFWTKLDVTHAKTAQKFVLLLKLFSYVVASAASDSESSSDWS